MKIHQKFSHIALLTLAVIASFYGISRAATLASAPALYSGYLASGIGTADTSMTLSTGVLKDGTSLTGWQCFTVDANTPSTEYICGNASGTAISNLMRGVLVSNPNASSSALAYQHNRFATVDITDYPDLQILVRQLSGLDAINNQLFYSGVSTSTAPSSTSALPNWGQVTNFVTSVASSGAPDATQISKGLVQIATNAQIASGTATSTDGAQTLWNVVSAGQYGKTYGATPTVTTQNYGTATGTTSQVSGFSYSGSLQTVTAAASGTLVNGHKITSVVSWAVTISGAQGLQGLSSGNATGTAGLGGQEVGTITTSTVVMYLNIGGQPASQNAGGYNGGGGSTGSAGLQGGPGGGMTTFSAQNTFSQSTVLMVAAGGAGPSITNGANYAGGSGGGLTGGGSAPGTQTAGGVGSCSTGTAGQGGNGCYVGGNTASGGGGAGYWGGGSVNSGTSGGGSSFVASGLTSTSTSAGAQSGNGTASITITYNYSDPTESVTSTAVGTNFGGTVTVNASTTHLSPTTSTINFAPWTTNPSGVSCIALPWSNITPWVISENTASVEFGFSSAMVANSYNYNCTTY